MAAFLAGAMGTATGTAAAGTAAAKMGAAVAAAKGMSSGSSGQIGPPGTAQLIGGQQPVQPNALANFKLPSMQTSPGGISSLISQLLPGGQPAAGGQQSMPGAIGGYYKNALMDKGNQLQQKIDVLKTLFSFGKY